MTAKKDSHDGGARRFEEVRSNIMAECKAGGRLFRLQIDPDQDDPDLPHVSVEIIKPMGLIRLSAWTENEVEALREFWTLVADVAQPTARIMDRRAAEQVKRGNNQLKRLWREDGRLIQYTLRKFRETVTALLSGETELLHNTAIDQGDIEPNPRSRLQPDNQEEPCSPPNPSTLSLPPAKSGDSVRRPSVRIPPT